MPVLVVGLGNSMMSDDGVGLELAARLEAAVPKCSCWTRVEFRDAERTSPAVHEFDGRDAIVIFDSIGGGNNPGAFHVLEYDGWISASASSLYGMNARALLQTAFTVAESPRRLMVIGIEPDDLAAGSQLSETVLEALPTAIERSKALLRGLLPSGPCVETRAKAALPVIDNRMRA